MNQMANQTPYEECHQKFDAMIEPMTTMDLIQAQAAVRGSTEISDMEFYRAIHWELKIRSEARTKRSD